MCLDGELQILENSTNDYHKHHLLGTSSMPGNLRMRSREFWHLYEEGIIAWFCTP